MYRAFHYYCCQAAADACNDRNNNDKVAVADMLCAPEQEFMILF
jgi:hypothetical protein